MIGPIVAQTVCTLQQCNFCKDIDPDSWAADDAYIAKLGDDADALLAFAEGRA